MVEKGSVEAKEGCRFYRWIIISMGRMITERFLLTNHGRHITYNQEGLDVLYGSLHFRQI